jgi:hypothetical protein
MHGSYVFKKHNIYKELKNLFYLGRQCTITDNTIKKRMKLTQCSSKGFAYNVEYITHVPYYDDTIIAFVRKDMEIVFVT